MMEREVDVDEGSILRKLGICGVAVEGYVVRSPPLRICEIINVYGCVSESRTRCVSDTIQL